MKINFEQEKIFEEPIIFHLVVTAKCQGKCKGCINTFYIAFYGGEPLLELDKILKVKKILDSYYNFKYIIYTNGLLLRNFIKFKDEVLDFKFIIVSIDGKKNNIIW